MHKFYKDLKIYKKIDDGLFYVYSATSIFGYQIALQLW